MGLKDIWRFCNNYDDIWKKLQLPTAAKSQEVFILLWFVAYNRNQRNTKN